MMSAGLIDGASAVRFSNWTPDLGPTEWSSRDIWKEIEEALAKDDVRTAAGILRYYLEHIFKDVCHNLRVPVEFKGDGRYDLGDVLPPAVKRYKELLQTGKVTSESWGRTEEATKLENREKEVAKCFTASNIDQWQINPAIHYNEWANLTAKDFKPVANAFHDLVKKFFCKKDECGSLFYLTATTPKELDTLRCSCGDTSISLRKKK